MWCCQRLMRRGRLTRGVPQRPRVLPDGKLHEEEHDEDHQWKSIRRVRALWGASISVTLECGRAEPLRPQDVCDISVDVPEEPLFSPEYVVTARRRVTDYSRYLCTQEYRHRSAALTSSISGELNFGLLQLGMGCAHPPVRCSLLSCSNATTQPSPSLAESQVYRWSSRVRGLLLLQQSYFY